MHDAQPGAGQHGHYCLGHHRHIDGHPVAGHQTETAQCVGGPADLILELGVGDRASVTDGLTLPVNGDPFTVTRLDMPIHAVVGDVESAADEPLRYRSVGEVQDFGKGGVPGQPVGLFGPERQPVCVGVGVEVCRRVGVGREFGRRWIRCRNVFVRLDHGCERSHLTWPWCGYLVLIAGRCVLRDERRLSVRPTVYEHGQVRRWQSDRLA